MSHRATAAADRLIAKLRAAEQAAKEKYLAAVGNDAVSVAEFGRLGRDFAAATAKLDGAREAMRAIIEDES